MKKHGKLLLLLPLIVAAAMIYDSNSRLAVTEYSLPSGRLPESFEGFTVAQLSDLHGLRLGLEEELLRETAAAKPDIIAITGDMVDEGTDMERVEAFLPELCAIAPVYFVSGNHEWGSGRMEELKALPEETGISFLGNSFELITRGEESIVIAGVEDPNGPADMPTPPELVESIREEHGDSFLLLLGHRNYWAERYPELDADIILCGHAHGGIIRLPFLGGVLGTGFELFPEHVDGAVETERYTMIVSRGLGNSVPVPRFLNNPELVLLRLERE